MDLTPLIKALSDAGVTGLLLVAVLVGLPGYFLVRMILRQTAKTQDTLTEAIKQLTANQQSMQAGALRRDAQIDRMNDLEEKRIASSNEQKDLLKTQNDYLLDLKKTYESGHTFTKELTQSVISSTKDNSAAMMGLESAVLAHTKATAERLDKIPEEVASVLDTPFRLIRDDIAKLVDPGLAAQVVELIKPDVIALIERALADCIKDKPLVVEVEKDKTEPLTRVPTGALSPVDGNVNRTIAGVPDPDKPPTPPAGAVDAETGETRKVA